MKPQRTPQPATLFSLFPLEDKDRGLGLIKKVRRDHAELRILYGLENAPSKVLRSFLESCISRAARLGKGFLPPYEPKQLRLALRSTEEVAALVLQAAVAVADARISQAGCEQWGLALVEEREWQAQKLEALIERLRRPRATHVVEERRRS